MTASQKQAARKFVERWTFRRGSEKGEDQQFWNSLLGEVLGMDDVVSRVQYQVPVFMKDTTKFLDAWIPENRVLIEHKSRGVNLDAPQAGHGGLTPYEQAVEYDNARPFDEKARWIVTCNFDEFRIYDRAKPLAPPLTLKLGNLPKEAYRLAFLINPKEKAIDRELEISVQAGRIVGEIYDALLGQYVGGSQLAATAITMYAYDGATSRILTSTRDAPTLPPRTTSYLYNDWGEQAATVEVESFDVAPGLTNGVAWGRLATGWESNGLVTFTGSSLAFHVDEVVANGALFVKVFRDFNANGVYDADVDAFVSRRLTKADNGKTVTLRIGDSDGDGVPDSVELGEGTGPLDRLAYCFNLSLTYTDVFQTTNALTFTASFGTNRVYGPCVVGERTWTHDFGHLLATDGEKVSVSVWDDANRNGEWDAGETSNRYAIAVTGHDMVVTNALSYLNFDRNGNSLPDWWEVQEGLDAEGVARRAYDDPDGDGLVNLHEYWCGTHPLVPDGSNTLLSVVARAVDEQIRDRDPANAICKFIDYETNGTNGIFIPNTNFWGFGIDTSCASMWNDARNDVWGGICNGWNMAGTLISARHVIYAHHYAIPHDTTLYFIDASSNIYARTLIDSRYVSCDIRVGLLNSDLPSAVHPAKLLPSNYGAYIKTARGLPCVTFDQEEKLIVAELSGLQSFNERTSLSFAEYPYSDIRRVFYESLIGGDSGNPRFLLVGQELVLLCVMWKGGGGAGCFITHFIDEIQTSMDSLMGGYQLQFIDLEGFQRLPCAINAGGTSP